jgi:hypothetical protein
MIQGLLHMTVTLKLRSRNTGVALVAVSEVFSAALSTQSATFAMEVLLFNTV